MPSNRRGLRSSAAVGAQSTVSHDVSSPVSFLPSSTGQEPVQIITPGSKLPGLNFQELGLLREKQNRLRLNASATLNSLPAGVNIRTALEATLIFAQYEAGTAVCIDKTGWILTCSHCFGDDEEEYKVGNKRRWLLFYTGLAVQVECRVWDPKRDLALLKVITVETNEDKAGETPLFQSVSLSSGIPSYKMLLLCIGQPGRDDLESTSERKTKYNLAEVSEGTFRGMVKGVDPQDNSEIGTLMHDAWTYWGHSGAPLIRQADGTLVGLHSSWDDKTTMRHGIPQVAIQGFLREQVPSAIKAMMSDSICEREI